MLKIFIVILNYNGEKFILNCLRSVSELKKKTYDLNIILVDNNSDDKSLELVSKSYPRIKIIKSEANIGFAQGNNLGIRYALNNGADYVMLLNNDTIVDPFLVENLLIASKSSKDIGILAPKIYFAPGYEFHKERYAEKVQGKVIWYAGGIIDWKNILASHRGVDKVDIGQYNKIDETAFASGCCMLVKKEVFKKIGFLTKKYFLYYEDTDFCMRAKIAGFKIIFVPSGQLWHFNAGAIGGSGSSDQDYYITRNRYLFGLKYASLKVKILILKEAIITLFSSSPSKKMASIDFLLGRFGSRKNL